jgi:hypothetical protein
MSLAPSFLARIASPSIRTVFLCGCGGGFDFVHGMLLYPFLTRLGKRVVIGSYSFGDPDRIGGEAPVVFERGTAVAKRVSARSLADQEYAPEVHLAAFLDDRFPEQSPHAIYAYYARSFSVPLLSELYRELVERHAVDAIISVDGGSDSLMRGDEEGLGDPIEDCVTVTTVAGLAGVELKLLLTVGLGCDRYNHVSDAASLRAIAELTAAGGFLGAAAVEPSSEAFRFYRDCVAFLERRHAFRSVLAGAVISACEGGFGETVPARLANRLGSTGPWLWPLMSIIWAFDPAAVVERSLMARWIREETDVLGCHLAVARGREGLAHHRAVENLPSHEAVRGPASVWQRQRNGRHEP